MVSPLLPAFGCLQICLEFETDSLSVGWYRYIVYFSVGFAFRGLNPPLFLGFPCGTPPIKINLEFHFFISLALILFCRLMIRPYTYISRICIQIPAESWLAYPERVNKILLAPVECISLVILRICL